MKNTNIANIKTDVDGLFKNWVALTQPLHRLTDAESEIFLAFLKKRHFLSQNIKDETVLDMFLFSTDTRKEIMNSLGHKMGTFQNYLSSMRNKGVISDNRINKKLIPNYDHESDNFKLIYNFIING